MKRRLALIATIVLSVQLVLSAIVPVAASSDAIEAPVKAVVPSIVHEDVEGDLLEGKGSFDQKGILLAVVGANDSVKRTWIEDENGGYIESGVFPNEHTGLHYSPGTDIPAGKYKLTFYARTAYEGHKTKMCVMICDADGKYANFNDGSEVHWMNIGLDNKWTKVEYYFEIKAPLKFIRFRGSTHPDSTMPYCIDEVSLVPVKSIPSSFKWEQGVAVKNEELAKYKATLDYINYNGNVAKWNPNENYKVEGLMLNLDNTAHGVGAVTSEQVVYDWVKQFKGTHVTDMVMNIAESKCVYPTEVFFGWYGDGMTTYKDGKISTAAKNPNSGYVNHFETLGLDYLKTLSKALPEAGINMWMSIRMNDAHDRTLAESSLFSEYFFEHPEFRRAQYETKVDTYYAKIWDYSFPEIREKYLALLNESLDRYDVYGYQFEWQREIRLFHPGGEYAGVEILNQFHRDADAIISVYEEKYGHEIKFSVIVAPDLQTNYDFGLDVMTWVSEGIIDMVVPMGRHSTTCNELPVALWKSLLDPYGVELAPCIEHGISTAPNKKSHQAPDIEHYAGTSALYLSQGADQIQIYNILVSFDHIFAEKDKIAYYGTDMLTPETAHRSEASWWVLLTSIGSYEKLMTLNRKIIPTYNDVQPAWKSTGATGQFPMTLRVNYAAPLRIGMGDIPDGAKVTLTIAIDPASEERAPDVYVNSELCKFIEYQKAPEEGTEDFIRSENGRLVYEVPESVYDDMWAVVEVVATKRPGHTMDHAELRIEPATAK